MEHWQPNKSQKCSKKIYFLERILYNFFDIFKENSLLKNENLRSKLIKMGISQKCSWKKHRFLHCMLLRHSAQQLLSKTKANHSRLFRCRFLGRFITRDLSRWVKCPPLGVFLRDPSLYLREFLRKLLKTLNG